MPRLRITDQARTDLDDVWLYIAERSVRAADRLIAKLINQCWKLAEFPESGSSCEELAPRLRNFTVGNYVIFYRSMEDGIEVVRVLHGARDFPALF